MVAPANNSSLVNIAPATFFANLVGSLVGALSYRIRESKNQIQLNSLLALIMPAVRQCQCVCEWSRHNLKAMRKTQSLVFLFALLPSFVGHCTCDAYFSVCYSRVLACNIFWEKNVNNSTTIVSKWLWVLYLLKLWKTVNNITSHLAQILIMLLRFWKRNSLGFKCYSLVLFIWWWHQLTTLFW